MVEILASAMTVSATSGSVDILDRFADEWRCLCAESVVDQPFYRPEFVGAHLRTMFPHAKVVLITARLDGRLCLVLPLVEEIGTFSKMPVRKLRAPANFNCGRFDAVRSVGPTGEAAILATWRYLKKMEGWDLLQLRYSQAGSAIRELTKVAEADGFRTLEIDDGRNPYVPVPAQAELLNQMPRNARLRTKLRQIRRQVEPGSLRFYRVDRADHEVLDRLFALEASGWKGRENTAVNCHPQTRQFFDELAESAAHFGYLSLYMLEYKGELIAAHFSLTYRDRCYSPIVAYNEDFKELAPGHLIVSEILQDCVARGIRGYDITGQDQEWKMKWTDDAPSLSRHYIFKGPIGSLAYAVASKVRPAIGRLLPIKNKIA